MMNKNNVQIRVSSLLNLAEWIDSNPPEISQAIQSACEYNPWFTTLNCEKALLNIRSEFLNADKIESFLDLYDFHEPKYAKTVGLVLAGNIPLVGWHDIQMVYLSGHKAKIKLSSKDKVLIPVLLEKLAEYDAYNAGWHEISERISSFDAVIATGSNNSSRYFKEYFSKVPHIIRANRNSVAVIHGSESDDKLNNIATDVFSYFGLGCRNVSKLYLPHDYDLIHLLNLWDSNYANLAHHNKYRNNYEYNAAIWMLNKEKFYQANCVLLKEQTSLHARIASVNYEWYSNDDSLKMGLEGILPNIQCIVSDKPIEGFSTVNPGESQRPQLNDFADNIDTMNFLLKL